MRQSSDKFMDELLKDNIPQPPRAADEMMAGFEDKMADMIDKRIDAAFAKFKEQIEKAAPVPPEESSGQPDVTEVSSDQYIRPEEEKPGVDSTIENK